MEIYELKGLVWSLYREADAKYAKYRKEHDGEWNSGNGSLLDVVLAYKRVLKLIDAKSQREVSKYLHMEDRELIREKIN